MNRELVEKWVEALESGKYRQANGTLCEVDKHGRYSYCCLGVGARVCGLKKIKGDVLIYGEYHDNPLLNAENQPYKEVASLLGVTAKRQDTLTKLNDEVGIDFKNIAKWIRKNILRKG